jgi:hypothetical protein
VKNVFVKWIPKSSGGRSSPPVGPAYWGIAKFKGRTEGADGDWSFELQFENPNKHESHYAQGKFLVPEAPVDLLISNSEFELCEGGKVVATVSIL